MQKRRSLPHLPTKGIPKVTPPMNQQNKCCEGLDHLDQKCRLSAKHMGTCWGGHFVGDNADAPCPEEDCHICHQSEKPPYLSEENVLKAVRQANEEQKKLVDEYNAKKPQPEHWEEWRVKILREIGVEDHIPAILRLIQLELSRQKEQILEVVRGMKKVGSDGKGLPFENSPEIYGNQRVEAYKNGFNSALSDVEEKMKDL